MPFKRTKEDVARLREQLEQSRMDMRQFRRMRREIIRHYVGSHYSEFGSSRITPRNILRQAAVIYTVLLAGGTPQVLLLTFNRDLKPITHEFGAVINHRLLEIDFGTTLAKLVLDAFLSIGIAKVGSDWAGNIDRLIDDKAIMEPFVAPVGLDNWVQDMRVPSYSRAEFAGDRIRVPVDLFKTLADRGYYSKEAAKRVSPSGETASYINEDGELRASSISVQEGTGRQIYRPYVELWELWLPDEQISVTIPDQSPNVLLRVARPDCPETGPYYQLGFIDVPDNPLPLAPAADLLELHISINQANRKMISQMLRQKSTVGYPPGASDDARRYRDVQDGQLFECRDPNSMKTVTFPGVDAVTQNFAIYMERIFDEQAGNLKTLGGLATGAETLGQEQLLASQAGQQVGEMRLRVLRFVEAIVRDLADRWWRHPSEEYRGRFRLGDNEFEIPPGIPPEVRQSIDFPTNFRIQVHPYSMRYQGPEERTTFLIQLVSQVILPAMPIIEAQGGQLKLDKFLAMLGRYKNLPEIEELIEFGAPPPHSARETVRQAPVTNRIQTRISRSASPHPQAVPAPEQPMRSQNVSSSVSIS